MARSEPDTPADSNVYLIADAISAALVDAGAGRDPHRILDEIAATGVTRIAFVALTHKHADYSGGAARRAAELRARVYAPATVVAALASADADASNITAAAGPALPVRLHNRASQRNPVGHGMSLPIGHARLEVHANPGLHQRPPRLPAATWR